MLISIEVNDAGRMCLAIAQSIKIYRIYRIGAQKESKNQISENKYAVL